MPLFAPGLPPALVPTMVTLAQIMFPIVVLLGLTGLVVGILQAGGQFGATAFVPVLWNVVILVCLVAVTPLVPSDDRIYVYAVGILVGTLAQLLYLLPYLRGRGPFPLSLGLRNPYVRRVLVLMLPVTISLGLINVNPSVDAVFATLVSNQAVRAIDAAFRLYILPQGVFSVAISTVLFPTISRLAARGDTDGLRHTIAAGQRQIFFMLLPGVGVPDGAERAGRAARVPARRVRRGQHRSHLRGALLLHARAGVQRREPAADPGLLQPAAALDADQGRAWARWC